MIETKLSNGNPKILDNNQEKISNENTDKMSSLITANANPQEKPQSASKFKYF